MKRSFIIVALCFLFAQSFSQSLPINEKTGKVTYMDVVSSGTLKPQQLYDIVKEFIASKGFENIVDEPGRKLKYNGKFKLSYPGVKSSLEDGLVKFTFTADLKDGKYRYILTDFVHVGQAKYGSGGKLESKSAECGPNKMKSSSWVKIKNTTHSKANSFVEALKKRVLEVQNDPEANDDW